MLKIKRILSKKGFSLIELMVALAILGIAALGIFQAYTVGFQSMTDAKDRTVATNIAQKKLEEVKNSVKVAYPYYNIGYQELNGKTFTIIVATNSKEDNLEQVIVTVSWKNRNGIEKNVQLETLVYDLKTTIVNEPDVGRLHLSADPTEIICCVEGEISTITAELFDKSVPVQMVPSGTPVNFQVNNGSVNPEFTVTDTMGKATTQLTINGLSPAAHVTVTATSGIVSSSDPGSDGAPLEVTCVPKASKIVLSASPSDIFPDNSSTITATVTDTCGNIILEEVTVEFTTNDDSDIYFLVEGEQITTTSVSTVDGVATVDLYIAVSGKTATVTGTVTPVPVEGDAISDKTMVICTDYIISVSANPTNINPGGVNNTSTITAVLTQSGGSPAVGKTINFSTDIWTIETINNITDENGEATALLTNSSLGQATVTVKYGTFSDTVTVNSIDMNITITAEPVVRPDETCKVTATLTDGSGNPLVDKSITFISDTGELSSPTAPTNDQGEAYVNIVFSVLEVGVNTVTAEYLTISDDVDITCTQYQISVDAEFPEVYVGVPCTITATLTNEGSLVEGETIQFSSTEGTIYVDEIKTAVTDNAKTDASGAAKVYLFFSEVDEGKTATITVTYIISTVPLRKISDTTTVKCKIKKNVGDSYGGGIVAYILVPGDPGYDASIQQGLIAATADQSNGIRWYNGLYIATGATGTLLGTGFANTNTIISIQGATTTSYAAGLARAYSGGGYTDWYLPSKDELNKLWVNRAKIGGFSSSGYYWSSSEYSVYSAYYAWYQYFGSGYQSYSLKSSYSLRVRAVRAF
jgi:type II secretion system protein I